MSFLSETNNFCENGYDIGESIIFKIKINLLLESTYIKIGVGVNNSLGERVTTLHTDYSEIFKKDKLLKGEYTVYCKIEGLNLKPGAYPIKLHLNAAGKEFILEPAFYLTIKDNFNFSKTTNHFHNGSVLCNQYWYE
ncbi:Wzt carbohydrate-binding domain-containing protein [Methylocucumis oryzae]|uniref:Uncharacterized protein n=1 Tax=Methylocucumis oryzae TaxID=1632867 RepID=A0A0F3IJ10_9GAMM|nr:Wzt carbohydrate-binding domain-containing protein [Methylocucumis oryzae]KJV05514.1 hypothetical protein VZ94_17630 [Methylocucumis oryzae]